MHYIKIGEQVTVSGFINVGSVSGSPAGTLRLSGLPFTVASVEPGGAEYSVGTLMVYELTGAITSGNSIAPFRFDSGETTIQFYTFSGAGLNSTELAPLCATNTSFFITGTYWVS